MQFEIEAEAQPMGEEPRHPADLNRATAEELEAIPGIGPALAQRIVEYREAKGAFLSTEQITAVSGIGPVLYNRISDLLTVALPEAKVEGEAVPVSEEVEAEEEAAPVLEEAEVEAAAVAAEAGVEEGAALAPEGAMLEEVMAAPGAEPRAPGPVTEGAAPTARLAEAPPAREAYRRGGLTWLWSALLGALLGVVFTLLILMTINGSLNLRHAPVILDIENRMETLSTRVSGLQDEVHTLQGRVDLLEGLPSRMDAVEATADELSDAMHALNQNVDALHERVDAVQDDLAVVQTQAEKVATFFQRLQTLLFDVFGMEIPEASTSGQ